MGSNPSPNGFPWIVRIELNDGTGNFCGGNIIAPKLILTGYGIKLITLFNEIFKQKLLRDLYINYLIYFYYKETNTVVVLK